MRTTVTIDDDIALRLEQRRADRGQSFKQVINDTLRAGLDAAERGRATDEKRRTRQFDLGLPTVDLSCTAEALAYAEGEDFK
jgi:plasmid stability protein